MRYLAIMFLFTSAIASAQETYSVGPASVANVTTLSVVIGRANREMCAVYSLAANCAQGAVCVAAGTPGGNGCTPAQARAAGVRIYPVTFAGREEFVTFGITLPRFLELVNTQQAENRKVFCDGWIAATPTARSNACVAIGLATTCDPVCP